MAARPSKKDNTLGLRKSLPGSMVFFERSELKGILILVLVTAVVGGLLAVASGKLETWFGITLFSGPRLYDKIVFVAAKAGSGEIYAMNPDGSDVRRLTEDVRVIGGPSVSPNGARVVFVGRADKSSQVFVVRSGGGKAEMLTTATGAKQSPQFSPDGRRLAFISGGTVYVSDQDGSNLYPVLPTEEETGQAMIQREPLPPYKAFVWSPNGEGMAGVVRDTNLGDMIVILPKIGGKAQRIGIPADGKVTVLGISWIPESKALAVLAEASGRSTAFVIDLAEKSIRAIASTQEQKLTSIAVSPDGTQAGISFLSEKPAPGGIVLVDIATGEGRLLTEGAFTDISYSPLGDKLLAHTTMPEPGFIVVVEVDSGKVHKLAKGFDAVWSPPAPK